MTPDEPKVQGVPRETRERNSIAALQDALRTAIPQCNWAELPARLEGLGFFAAGMQEQVRILAQGAIQVACAEPAALLRALGHAPEEKARGVAAFAVPLLYPESLEAQLDALTFTGALAGTWPHELSATVLHNLIIEQGIAVVAPWLLRWTASEDEALRRMAIEALRPRGVMLAHIQALKVDPAPLKSLLAPLLDDPSDYVRRAVANNLNDVSRDNPEAALAWAGEWMTSGAGPERRWVLGHALRSLLDQGYPEALRILGYAPAETLSLAWEGETPARMAIGEALRVRFRLANLGQTEALAHLLIHIDAPGLGERRRSLKYQVWRGTLQIGETRTVAKSIRLRDTSTQRKEPGICRWLVRLNGATVSEREIELLRP